MWLYLCNRYLALSEDLAMVSTAFDSTAPRFIGIQCMWQSWLFLRVYLDNWASTHAKPSYQHLTSDHQVRRRAFGGVPY
jgi:hypothetical protein